MVKTFNFIGLIPILLVALIAGVLLMSTGPAYAVIDYSNELVNKTYLGNYQSRTESYSGPGSAAVMSADGRYIVFSTDGNDIVANDTHNSGPNQKQTYLRDRTTGTTIRMTKPDGSEWAYGTIGGAISGNGHYVVFRETTSSNTSGNSYIYNVRTGSESVITSNFQPYAVSDDGRFVAGISKVSSTNYSAVYDMHLNQLDVMSFDYLVGNSSPVGSTSPRMSCDGRYIAFSSNSSSIVPNDTNQKYDIFLVDRVNGYKIKNITIDGNGDSMYFDLSCDGKNIVFNSASSNFVDGDNNNTDDTFVFNIEDENFIRASVATGGAESSKGTVAYSSPSITNGGRYVVFTSAGNDLSVTNNSSYNYQVYLRDMVNNTTVLASGYASPPYISYGATNDAPTISANGNYIVFRSTAYLGNTPYTNYKPNRNLFLVGTGNTAMTY